MFLYLPTGFGKSLMYQLPDIFIEEKEQATALLVAPLISINVMKDEMEHVSK